MSLTESNQKAEQAPNSQEDMSENGQDLLSPASISFLAIFALVCLVFYKTIFLGMDISRAFLITQWDSVFASSRMGTQAISDPSVVQFLVPFHFICSTQWHELIFPLWTNLFGFGAPILADIQSGVLSPLRLPFYLAPSMHAYNLTLVLYVLLGASGSFLFARAIGLGYIASVFAGITYGFCPNLLSYIEWMNGGSNALLPFVFWSFYRLSRSLSMGNVILAGSLCAALIVSGHPESSFWIISFSSLMLIILGLLNSGKTKSGKGNSSGKGSSRNTESGSNETGLNVGVGKAFLGIIGAGIGCLCLCGPVFFPFVEFVLNSDCYKFDAGVNAYIRWQGLCYDLLHAGYGGASLWLGCLAVVLLGWSLLGLYARSKSKGIDGKVDYGNANSSDSPEKKNGGDSDNVSPSMLATAWLLIAITFIFIARIEPIGWLLSRGMLGQLITLYAAPVFLFFIAMMMAYGLTYLLTQLEEGKVKIVVLSTLVFSAFSLLPYLLYLAKVDLRLCDFDLMLPTTQFKLRQWILDIVLVLSFAFLPLLYARFKNKFSASNKFAASMFLALAVAINFASQLVIVRTSLPAHAAFNYPQSEVMTFLKDKGRRALGYGGHVFKPIVNALYSVPSIQSLNALFPRGFVTYMNIAEARSTTYWQEFEGNLGKAIDLASVKYVVATVPIIGNMTAENSVELASFIVNNTNKPETKPETEYFTTNALRFDPVNFEIALDIKMNQAKTKGLTLCAVILDKQGNVIWFGDQLPCEKYAQEAAPPLIVSIPSSLRNTDNLIVALKFFDPAKGSFIAFAGDEYGDKALIPVAQLNMPEILAKVPRSVISAKRHFQLVKGYPEGFRLYENTQARPDCYMTGKARFEKTLDDSFAYMQTEEYKNGDEIVLTDQATKAARFRKSGSLRFSASNDDYAKAKIVLKRESPTHITIDVSCEQPGILVLTEQYYVGWQAVLDGVPVDHFRANGVFRALMLPSGLHKVEYIYQPKSLVLGLISFVAFFLTAALLGLFKLSFRRRK